MSRRRGAEEVGALAWHGQDGLDLHYSGLRARLLDENRVRRHLCASRRAIGAVECGPGRGRRRAKKDGDEKQCLSALPADATPCLPPSSPLTLPPCPAPPFTPAPSILSPTATSTSPRAPAGSPTSSCSRSACTPARRRCSPPRS